MIKVSINGTEYKNVSSVEPSIEYDFYHDVTTMDGVRHREVKGKRTNYTVVFFNSNFEEYDNLKAMLQASETVSLTVPTSTDGTSTADYYVTVTGNTLKGVILDGKFYTTGLTASFEKVGYDE